MDMDNNGWLLRGQGIRGLHSNGKTTIKIKFKNKKKKSDPFSEIQLFNWWYVLTFTYLEYVYLLLSCLKVFFWGGIQYCMIRSGLRTHEYKCHLGLMCQKASNPWAFYMVWYSILLNLRGLPQNWMERKDPENHSPILCSTNEVPFKRRTDCLMENIRLHHLCLDPSHMP